MIMLVVRVVKLILDVFVEIILWQRLRNGIWFVYRSCCRLVWCWRIGWVCWHLVSKGFVRHCWQLFWLAWGTMGWINRKRRWRWGWLGLTLFLNCWYFGSVYWVHCVYLYSRDDTMISMILLVDTRVSTWIFRSKRIDSTLPPLVIDTEECLKANARRDDRKARVVFLVWP